MNNSLFEDSLPRLKIMHAPTRYCTPHYHSHPEILLVNRGVVCVSLDGKIHKLEKNDCVMIFPGVIHNYFDPSVDNDTLMIVCAQDLLGSWGKLLSANDTDQPVIHNGEMNPDSAYALRSIMDRRDRIGEPAEKWSSFDTQHTTLLLKLFLSGVIHDIKLEPQTDSTRDQLAKDVINYLLKEYANPVSLDDVANALGVNRFRISRIFTNQLHISFSQYLNELRVDEAKRLLSETDLPITTVAFDCGFSAIRSFNRVFLEITGVSPRKYRQDNRQVSPPDSRE